MEPLITEELENAILRLRYQPTPEWAERASDIVAEERALNERAARRVLDVLCHVSRDFTEIELGFV